MLGTTPASDWSVGRGRGQRSARDPERPERVSLGGRARPFLGDGGGVGEGFPWKWGFFGNVEGLRNEEILGIKGFALTGTVEVAGD